MSPLRINQPLSGSDILTKGCLVNPIIARMKDKTCKTCAILCLTVLSILPLGCASQDSVQALEKRVAALEQKQADKAASDKERQSKLEDCINLDAEHEYWEYIRLNGKKVAGQTGVYKASQYDWSEATRKKKDKVEECRLLYGPRNN